MGKSTRRAFGLAALASGIALVVWSYCPLVLDVLDYFGVTDTWEVTCPSKVSSKMLFISGIVALVLGQRLLSGRKLHTGEKVE